MGDIPKERAMPIPNFAPFPLARPRRLRRSPWIRDLVQETGVTARDLIWPLFIIDGADAVEPVESMPGVERRTVDRAVDLARKTPGAEEAWNPDNLVNTATRAIKKHVPEIGVMLDVALDPYNSDGHDGIVRDGVILIDETLLALEKEALSHAEAGADILGPSDMMDGRIGVIRQALESNDFQDVMIMSYAAKYASAFYGPFRDAVGATGALKGDKKTYQMDPSNTDEALKEVAIDIAEGADMVMVKPGMPYLDVCQRVKQTFHVPTFAYQVSGEYAMIRAAALNGWLDGEKAMVESLAAFKRAGCDGVLTYFALDVARMLTEGSAGPAANSA
jgi:porphobilinogen synthase